MLGGGCVNRISHHFRECELHFQLGVGFRFSFCGLHSFHLSFPRPLKPKPCWGGIRHCCRPKQSVSKNYCSGGSPSKSSPGEIPLLLDSFSQQEDEREIISDGISAVAGGIVALGKFDALHIGHRELAIQASRAGPPFLLSFVGMAKVLNIGENYRFGYKAAGDALELAKLCEEYGIEAYIIKSVMDKNCCSTNINFNTNSKERGQVSSTRVREALAVGDMRYVSELLGRKHRLILMATDQERFSFGQYKVSAPKSCLLNLAPKEGLYEKCSLLLGQENVMQCRVIIDGKFVHIETDYRGQSDIFGTQNLRFLHIEFGDSSN